MNGNHVRAGSCILAGDMDRMVRFYRDTLGLQTQWLRFPAGGPITYPFGIRNFYVADPEGNLIEIGSTNEA